MKARKRLNRGEISKGKVTRGSIRSFISHKTPLPRQAYEVRERSGREGASSAAGAEGKRQMRTALLRR